MPSKPDSGIHFRDQHLAEHLDGYHGRDQRYQTAKHLLRRYRWFMEATLADIAMQPIAAIALWIELNGCHTRRPEELPILQQSVASALHDSGHEALAASIKALSLVQWLAVVDACDRVGNGSYQVDDLEDELKRAGLIKAQEDANGMP